LDQSGSEHGAGGVGGLLAINSTGNGTHFYSFDGNDNVATLTSSTNGNVTAEYEYDPFLNPLRVTGPVATFNGFTASGKYWDHETGCYYYGFRYLRNGRWLSRDPIEEAGGPNPYAFVENRPTTQVDVLGLRSVAITFYIKPGPGSPLITKQAETHLRNIIRDTFSTLRQDNVHVIITRRAAKPDELGKQYERVISWHGRGTGKGCLIGYGVEAFETDGNRASGLGHTSSRSQFELFSQGFEEQDVIFFNGSWPINKDIAVANTVAHESLFHAIADFKHSIKEKLLETPPAHGIEIDLPNLTRELAIKEGVVSARLLQKLKKELKVK